MLDILSHPALTQQQERIGHADHAIDHLTGSCTYRYDMLCGISHVPLVQPEIFVLLTDNSEHLDFTEQCDIVYGLRRSYSRSFTINRSCVYRCDMLCSICCVAQIQPKIFVLR